MLCSAQTLSMVLSDRGEPLSAQGWVHQTFPAFVERLAYVPGLSVDGDGAMQTKRSMPPDGVTTPVDVSGVGVFGLLAGLPDNWPDQP